MWRKFKGFIFGGILGGTSLLSFILLLQSHSLDAIFLSGFFGVAIGYISLVQIMDQIDQNKRLKTEIIKSDEDLLEDESLVDEEEYYNVTTINSNNHYARNYIQRLTEKKKQEKIENRSRSVEACIIDTKEYEEDNIEL